MYAVHGVTAGNANRTRTFKRTVTKNGYVFKYASCVSAIRAVAVADYERRVGNFVSACPVSLVVIIKGCGRRSAVNYGVFDKRVTRTKYDCRTLADKRRISDGEIARNIEQYCGFAADYGRILDFDIDVIVLGRTCIGVDTEPAAGFGFYRRILDYERGSGSVTVVDDKERVFLCLNVGILDGYGRITGGNSDVVTGVLIVYTG